MAACVASILELPIEEVDFDGGKENWLEDLNEKLKPFGMRWLEIDLEVAEKYPIYRLFGQICIMTGKSPRGDYNHAVVGELQGDDKRILFETIHDPHPDQSGIVDGKAKLVGFFIPIHPHKMRRLMNL